MKIIQMVTGPMAVFTYIVSCEVTGEGLVIDPGGNEEEIYRRAINSGVQIRYIVNTHGHADHTCGNRYLKELSGAKILMHYLDDEMFNSPEGQMRAAQMGFEPSPPADITLRDGDTISFGNSKLKVLHTPGHSPGGICLYGEKNLFTGDTLFVGAIGRTDFPGCSLEQLLLSIKTKILTLPPDTIIWPGHHYGPTPTSTIANEMRTNPYITDFILA